MRKFRGKTRLVMLTVMVTMFLAMMSTTAMALNPQPEPPMPASRIINQINILQPVIGAGITAPSLIIH
ncbi:MAG: hypothetical protein ACM3UZ_09180 [Acidobacteriota bacterium]